MATLDELSNALVKADAAGDTEAARAFAAEIRKMRTPAQPKYDPTEGMSGTDKFLAGVGKAMTDVGRGAGQLVGLVDRKDVEESRRLDAPLMNTGAGVAGNIAGAVGMLAPTALIPGANTLTGAGAIGAVTGLLQPSTSTGETLTNVGIGGAAGMGGQYLANKLPGMASKYTANKLTERQAAQAGNAQKFAAAQAGAGKGYVIPPADLEPGVMTEMLSGLSGKIKTAQVASQKNQQVTNRLAKGAIGLNADDAITADVLQGIRNQTHQAAYEPLRNIGQITADKSYLDALDKIAATSQGASRSFPGLKDSPVEDLVNTLRQNAFDSSDAIDATRVLRDMADKAYRQGDNTLGKAAKSASDAIEGVIERNLQATGQQDVLKAFRDGRQLMAKTYTVQKALNSQTGDVSAQEFAKQLSKGKPLSGDLKMIAEMGQAFPKATQALKEAPKSVSPLDFAVGGMTGAASNNPLMMAAVGARPVVRSALLSSPMQRMAMQQGQAKAPMIGSAIDNQLFKLLMQPAAISGGLALNRE